MRSLAYEKARTHAKEDRWQPRDRHAKSRQVPSPKGDPLQPREKRAEEARLFPLFVLRGVGGRAVLLKCVQRAVARVVVGIVRDHVR